MRAGKRPLLLGVGFRDSTSHSASFPLPESHTVVFLEGYYSPGEFDSIHSQPLTSIRDPPSRGRGSSRRERTREEGWCSSCTAGCSGEVSLLRIMLSFLDSLTPESLIDPWACGRSSLSIYSSLMLGDYSQLDMRQLWRGKELVLTKLVSPNRLRQS